MVHEHSAVAAVTLPDCVRTRRSVLLLVCRRVGDMGEQGERHFCGDSGGCSNSSSMLGVRAEGGERTSGSDRGCVVCMYCSP